MRRNTLLGAAALVAMLPLSACEMDDLLDLPENELTSEETMELASALVGQAYTAADDETTADPEQQGSVSPQNHGGGHFERSVEVTAPCPQGGEVAIVAEVAGATYPEENRIVVEMAGTKTHAECGVVVRGRDVVIDGNPNIGWSARFERVEGQPHGEQRLTLEGAFTWSTPTGRSGDCAVNLTVTYHPDAQERTVSGTFCGAEIESTTSWTTA